MIDIFKKNKRGSTVVIIVVAALVVLAIAGSIFFIIRGKNKSNEAMLSQSGLCGSTSIEFNLISCEYTKSGIFHDSTVKFKRTDNSGIDIQKVTAWITSDKRLGFEELSAQNLFTEQEEVVSVYGVPNSFSLMIVLDEQTSCRIEEISCTEIIVEETQESQQETDTSGDSGQESEEESEETTGESSTDQIEEAIREALGI
jgi:hypothetical protein